MSDHNDTALDILKAVGFVAAVILGGLFIAGVIDGFDEAREEAAAEVDDERPPAD